MNKNSMENKMRNKISKHIGLALLVGSLALVSGCGRNEGRNEEYCFSGRLGNEEVSFTSTRIVSELLVKKENGIQIGYKDWYNDGILDNLYITDAEGNLRPYKDDAIGSKIMPEAQRAYDSYLSRILQFKQNRDLYLFEGAKNKMENEAQNQVEGGELEKNLRIRKD